MNAVDIFSIIKDIALSAAACTTAYVAYNGVEKWQKELKGKANFEVARDLAKTLYSLRDEISYCRSPFVAAQEFPESYVIEQSKRKLTPEEKGQAWAYVYTKRWEPVSSAIQAFDAATLEAEAIWGQEIKEKANKLRQCTRSLEVDIEAFIENEYSGGKHFKDREFGKKVRQSISDTKSKENELTQRINKAIEGIELEIKPHLSRR
ncbi:hypothetical protein GHNINEIG_02137 [Hydrogenovibrio crunogenus]|uniref:Uncharacterized protein n=1 Tax=Hydrogenovibrio crunogenus TaxID=39765 RepID=A0A4P7P3U0_9GAMM|nr:hypothetical protein [Hydrogenovibrio crunogenus]QBZ84062.1 hypothetical protein GHNINEIG_02137 [Hydrogenovibrio crunogenus]